MYRIVGETVARDKECTSLVEAALNFCPSGL
jgi:hypothetical protein